MAITIGSTGSVSTTRSGNLVVDLPDTITADSVLVCFCVANDNVVSTMPAGWELDTGLNNTTALRTEVWYKQADGSESGTVTMTRSSGGVAAAQILAYSGAYLTGDPIEAAATSANSASTSATVPSVTSLTTDALITAMVGAAGATSFGALSGSTPTLTERTDTTFDPRPQFVALVSGTNSTGATSVSVTLPSGLQDGDMAIAVVSGRFNSNTGNTITATDWQSFERRDQGTTTALCSEAFWKAVGASDSSSTVTFNFGSGTNYKAVAQIVIVRGAHTTTPINQDNSQANASSATCTAAAVTPGQSNTLLLWFGTTAVNTTLTTSPASGAYTKPSTNNDVQSTGGGGGTRNTLSFAYSPTYPTSGVSTGTVAGTFGSAAINNGHLVAVAAAVPSASTPVSFSISDGTLASAGATGSRTSTITSLVNTGIALALKAAPPPEPTVVTRYVNTASSGGDGTTNNTSGATAAYASLSAAEAAERSARGNLVSGNEVLIIECSGSADDTTAVDFQSGWTTDATRYIEVRGDNTTGKWDATKYTLVGTDANVFLNTGANHMRVRKVQLQFTASSTNATAGSGFRVSARAASSLDVRFDSCIVKGVINASSTGANVAFDIRIDASGQQVVCTNCVVYDYTGTAANNTAFQAFPSTATTAQRIYLYNCTVGNTTRGINLNANGNGTLVAKNCLVQASNPYNNAANFHADSTNNLSNTATVAGSNGLTSKTVTFVDAANGDFHIGDSDTTGAKTGGANLTSDSSFAFSTDIDGTTRPAPSTAWSIGADEYAVSAVTGAGDASTTASTAATTTITASADGTASTKAASSGTIDLPESGDATGSTTAGTNGTATQFMPADGTASTTGASSGTGDQIWTGVGTSSTTAASAATGSEAASGDATASTLPVSAGTGTSTTAAAGEATTGAVASSATAVVGPVGDGTASITVSSAATTTESVPGALTAQAQATTAGTGTEAVSGAAEATAGIVAAAGTGTTWFSGDVASSTSAASAATGSESGTGAGEATVHAVSAATGGVGDTFGATESTALVASAATGSVAGSGATEATAIPVSAGTGTSSGVGAATSSSGAGSEGSGVQGMSADGTATTATASAGTAVQGPIGAGEATVPVASEGAGDQIWTGSATSSSYAASTGTATEIITGAGEATIRGSSLGTGAESGVGAGEAAGRASSAGTASVFATGAASAQTQPVSQGTGVWGEVDAGVVTVRGSSSGSGVVTVAASGASTVRVGSAGRSTGRNEFVEPKNRVGAVPRPERSVRVGPGRNRYKVKPDS